MLFGGTTIRHQIVEDAKKYAQENGYELVYGAMVGGISKGLQYADSDYDTRFLYLDKEHLDKIYFPWDEKEDDLKHRCYFEDKPYEWIPLWEMTSFIQFLKKPAFDGKVSYGLYNIVGWTFQSPYAWDPYGLQMKLVPLINRAFRSDYFVPYHAEQINQYFSEEEIVIKDYLYAIYSALAIRWAQQNATFQPVYMKTLVRAAAPDYLKQKLLDLIEQSKKVSAEYLATHRNGNMHDSHFIGKIKHDKEIDAFIKEMLAYGTTELSNKVDEEYVESIIREIYGLVKESIRLETKVYGVS